MASSSTFADSIKPGPLLSVLSACTHAPPFPSNTLAQHLREEDTWPLTPLICAVAPIKNCSTTPRSVLCITWKCTSQACAKHMHSSWNSDYSHCLLFHRLLHCMASDEIHQCIDHWFCRPRGRECPLHVSDQEATEPAKHARYAAKASSI